MWRYKKCTAKHEIEYAQSQMKKRQRASKSQTGKFSRNNHESTELTAVTWLLEAECRLSIVSCIIFEKFILSLFTVRTSQILMKMY